GQIMSPFQQARLKLTDEQKKQIEALQKQADTTLEKTLTEDQKKQFKDIRDGLAGGGPGGFGRGGAKGPGGMGGFPGGGFAGFGPPGGSSLFRVYRYAANYSGLAGKELIAG